jgi:hypothetical protein
LAFRRRASNPVSHWAQMTVGTAPIILRGIRRGRAIRLTCFSKLIATLPTLDVADTVSTTEKADSIKLVLAKLVRSFSGTRNRWTARVSSQPSSRLRAAGDWNAIGQPFYRCRIG